MIFMLQNQGFFKKTLILVYQQVSSFDITKMSKSFTPDRFLLNSMNIMFLKLNLLFNSDETERTLQNLKVYLFSERVFSV